jgi:hypothetical protein
MSACALSFFIRDFKCRLFISITCFNMVLLVRFHDDLFWCSLFISAAVISSPSGALPGIYVSFWLVSQFVGNLGLITLMVDLRYRYREGQCQSL